MKPCLLQFRLQLHDARLQLTGLRDVGGQGGFRRREGRSQCRDLVFLVSRGALEARDLLCPFGNDA